jgi:hypothetical protein
MKLPRVRFTVRRLMIAVALTALGLAWVSDRARRGYPLVVFEYAHYIEKEPFSGRTTFLDSSWRGFTLADGRLLRIENGPWCEGMIGWEDRDHAVLDIEYGPAGSIAVYTLQPEPGVCGNCAANCYVPPIRLPLMPRIKYRNYRALVGYGRIVPVSGELSSIACASPE